MEHKKASKNERIMASENLISVDSLRQIRSAAGEDETRLLMVGLPGSGKNTLLTSISSKDEKLHDMGNQKFRVRNLIVEGLNITVWDVGNDVYVDPYWSDYHAERIVGLIFVVDSADTDKIEEARSHLIKTLGNEKLHNVPLLVMCNKCDVEGAMSVVQVSDALKLAEQKNPNKPISTSATTKEGIQAGLEWLVSQKFSRT